VLVAPQPAAARQHRGVEPFVERVAPSLPQYVPGDGTDHAYLVTTAFRGQDEKQIWIFDAKNLAQGPICKLGSDAPLPFAYTLHCTYLRTAVSRTEGGYRVAVLDEIAPGNALVDEWVVPNAYQTAAAPSPVMSEIVATDDGVAEPDRRR
jgi:hypothetical protein